MSYKDHFSEGSSEYSEYRPHYPEGLFSYLASLCSDHNLAWDCATGSGQAAINLADLFLKVWATDASVNQIESAIEKSGITYKVAQAEDSELEDATVDLVTVAQALHWFDIEAFSAEVSRVLKKDGILAVWTYNLLEIQEVIDKSINQLYKDILGPFWPAERRLVENGYSEICLPFDEIRCPSFKMNAEWDFPRLIGYLNTWSAVREYKTKNRENPIEMVYGDLLEAWGDPGGVRAIKWLLTTKVWRKTHNQSVQADQPVAGR